MRFLAPAVGGFFGSKDRRGSDGETEVMKGAVIGAVAASLVDGIAFGWERPEP